MLNGRGIANYVVKYNSDPRLVTDNHQSNIVYLIDVDERGFNNLCDAIVFLSECISPITKIEELVPELKKCKKFNYILPERNIVVKHQLTPSMDIYFPDLNWEWD
jgi:hypothetical protein